MNGIAFDYSWTDERGVEHFYPRLFGWHCSIHSQVCSPFKPITGDDLLALAAKDPALDDDAFRVLARVVDGRPIVDQDEERAR